MILVLPAIVMAQGTIVGKVTDGETGEPLRGATVFVEAVKKGAYSDTKGAYRVKGVPAGTYTLKFTYVGYDAKIVENVVVNKDKTTTVNVVLMVTKTEGKEVIVETTRANDNAAALLAQRKNAAQVSDGVGKEEMSKLNDGDAGQALKRVSGVTLVEGKYVFVRGTSDRYSNTTLNGAALTSTEPDKKSFAFDMFPSDLLENANVVKSFTPDLPGNFAGGLVQLNTIDFPQGTSLKISGSQGFNDFVTFKDNGFFRTAGVSGDALVNGASGRAMPSDVPADRSGMNELLRDVRAGNADAIARMDRIGQTFNNQLWQTGTETVTPNGSLSLTYTDIFTFGESDQLGVVASANYGTSYQNNAIVRAGILSNPEDFLFKFNGRQSTQSTSLGGLFNIAYRIGTTSTISFKNAYNRSGDIDNVYLSGWGLVGAGQAKRDWDLAAIVGYRINDSLSAVAGYRALGVDYSKNGFVFDAVQQGPILGLVVDF